MSKKKNTINAQNIEQAKIDAHIKALSETTYEVNGLVIAQIVELLQHLGSIPYYDVIGAIGNQIGDLNTVGEKINEIKAEGPGSTGTDENIGILEEKEVVEPTAK